MTQRETIVQVVKVECDTSRIEEYERLRLLANQAPTREEERPMAAVVHFPQQKWFAWTSLGLGFTAVALLATGVLNARLAPAPAVIVHIVAQAAEPRGSGVVTFHRQALGRLEVVTLWRYSNVAEIFGMPSRQLCFVGRPQQPGLPIAMDGVPLDMDATFAARLNIAPEDIKNALPLCTWYGNDRADDITIETRA